MPSSPTARNRLEKQAVGENVNTWGDKLNQSGLDLLDEALDGVEPVTITGAGIALTSSNYASDQARNRCLVLTGTLTGNATITIPSVEKVYLVVNNTTQGAYSLTMKTSGGTGYALRPGPQDIYCDGGEVRRGSPRLNEAPLPDGPVSLNGQRITGLGSGTAPSDAVTKAQMETAVASGAFPASPTAGAVKITSADTAPQFLDGAVQVTAPLTKTVQNSGADETLLLALNPIASADLTASLSTTIARSARRSLLNFSGTKI